MARKKTKNFKRDIKPDSVFNDVTVSKFINCITLDGKKGAAEKCFYAAMDIMKTKMEDKEPLEVFRTALENVKPMIEVRSRRVGGVTYQVPVSIRPERRQTLGIRWLVNAARSRNEYGMDKRLAAEFLDAFKGSGVAIKKKEDTRKMADANKAFAHYRW